MAGEANLMKLLHLCDSLFPIGGFSYSDGLEFAAAKVRLKPDAPYKTEPDTCTGARSLSYGASGFSRTSVDNDLRDWLDACLDETIARFEGPAVRDAWNAFIAGDRETLAALDGEVIALRPSSTTRRATRAMGSRLMTTWGALHPDARLDDAAALALTLPVAFGIVCAAASIGRREAIAGFAYTRLASTASAAMRLLPLGQTAAHRMLARTLDRVPAALDAIEASSAPLACFTPLMDIAAMSQQYLHSRLFRS